MQASKLPTPMYVHFCPYHLRVLHWLNCPHSWLRPTLSFTHLVLPSHFIIFYPYCLATIQIHFCSILNAAAAAAAKLPQSCPP